MKRTDVFSAYLERVIGQPLDDVQVRFLSGWQVVEALWPLLERVQPLHARLASLAYDPAFEADADAALERLGSAQDDSWDALPADVLRVLSERIQQAITVATANEASGNLRFMPVPSGLTAPQTTVGAALWLLHRMRLPWPPGHQSGFERPPGSARAPMRRQ